MTGLAGIIGNVTAAAEDFAELAATVRRESPQARLVPQTPLPGAEAIPDPLPRLSSNLASLSAALQNLSDASKAALPGARFFPTDAAGALVADAAQTTLDALVSDLDAFQSSLLALADDLGDDRFFVPTALVEGEEADLLARALDTYTTPTGEAARLVVTLDDEPYSDQALDTVARLRDKVGFHSMGYVQGPSATYRDVFDVTARDMVRIVVLVLAGMSIVLVLLMRSLVAPLYMQATILLSYATTLGLTRLVFEKILDEKLTFLVPPTLFVFLAALGMDYNIFLMDRVKEEVARLGTRAGIRRALERTGGIISSAGITMAGTFAAMTTSSLLALVQIGFAVSAGVLLDTFLVRTTLVPAIAVLLGRWNWWPGAGPTGSAPRR